MTMVKCALGVAAAAMLTAQPCLAAEDFRESRASETRTGAFAGLSFRMPLDGQSSRRPTARLQLTGIRQVREASGATRTFRAEGVQIGAGRDGRLALTIAGQNPLEARERLGVGGSTGTTLLIVGGVVLVVYVLAAVAAATPRPGPHDGTFD
ncbi:MAG TPA: hypothetical protein VF577_04085 [Allosphingosinicella sp.]|jgi:hypothetical protein